MAPVLQGEPEARWGATQGSLPLVSPDSWSREGWPKREVVMINSVNFVLADSLDSLFFYPFSHPLGIEGQPSVYQTLKDRNHDEHFNSQTMHIIPQETTDYTVPFCFVDTWHYRTS